MNDQAFINLLIAEDNDVSREMMVSVLETQGFRVFGVADGDAAIQVIEKEDIDLALIDINMAPRGGFEFLRYLVANGIKLTTIVVTSDDSSDILVKANELGVRQVLQKPVEPGRLIQVVQRILKQKGLNPQPLAVGVHKTKFSPEDLMKRAIQLADENVKSKKGGPYGAVVASAEGEILGEGVNGNSSRVDPIAHAEVMAIRKAAEKLGRADLKDCVLYCSSMPTMMGKALIQSVSIQKVCYGLSYEDINSLSEKHDKKFQIETEFEQIGRDEAMAMFKNAAE